MTTIATDGKTMAGDGLITSNDRIEETGSIKVRRLSDGRVVGMCGDAFAYDAFAKWLEEGGDFPTTDGGFSGLTIDRNGVVRTWDDKGRSYVEHAHAAIGSGAPYALAAMDAGASPERAVQIACDRDVYSGGTITVLGIEP